MTQQDPAGSVSFGDVAARRQQLREIADGYFEAMRRRDFSAIRYDENISLRAPLSPRGVNTPLVGNETLRTVWWTPMAPALEGAEIEVLDYYFNDELTAICTEAEIASRSRPSRCASRTASPWTHRAKSLSRRTTSTRGR
jgi:hypothetical protein